MKIYSHTHFTNFSPISNQITGNFRHFCTNTWLLTPCDLVSWLCLYTWYNLNICWKARQLLYYQFILFLSFYLLFLFFYLCMMFLKWPLPEQTLLTDQLTINLLLWSIIFFSVKNIATLKWIAQILHILQTMNIFVLLIIN